MPSALELPSNLPLRPLLPLGPNWEPAKILVDKLQKTKHLGTFFLSHHVISGEVGSKLANYGVTIADAPARRHANAFLTATG